MYLGVDVGGTKTLVAVLNDHGVILEEQRLPTPKKYDQFLKNLEKTLASFDHKDFKAAGVGMPGPGLDRERGVGINFANLPWRNVPMQSNVEDLAGCPVVVENDAKMAALSESMLLKKEYKSVLYVTISTGIGYALVVNGVIDKSVGDAGGSSIILDHKGKLMPWEHFASGHAIVERYGRPAHDIEDKETWQTICRDLAKGLIHLIAIMQPEVIVIGGAVGVYFDRYGKLLQTELKKYDLPLIKLPELRGAQRPEEAVIYGCYDLAKQVFAHD